MPSCHSTRRPVCESEGQKRHGRWQGKTTVAPAGMASVWGRAWRPLWRVATRDELDTFVDDSGREAEASAAVACSDGLMVRKARCFLSANLSVGASTGAGKGRAVRLERSKRDDDANVNPRDAFTRRVQISCLSLGTGNPCEPFVLLSHLTPVQNLVSAQYQRARAHVQGASYHA